MLAPKLHTGDTVGIFSPSSPATAASPKRYARAKAFLASKGFRVKEGSLTGKKDCYRSGNIRERAEELNALLRDRSVRCVMAAIGGMNSNSLLPYLDYDAIRADPKVIVGYSDVTALLLGIYAKTGLVTYYGPAAVASFGEFPPFVEETWGNFSTIALGTAPIPHVLPTPGAWTEEFIPWEEQNCGKLPQENKLVTLHGGRAAGRLVGGNLNTFDGIWGTPYMPDISEGDILLIEDSLKDAATVERSFAHLKLSRVFDRIGGLILGKHELFDDQGTGRTPADILTEVMGPVSFPVLARFDCCHTHPMLTVPIGVRAELDADEQRVTLLEEYIG